MNTGEQQGHGSGGDAVEGHQFGGHQFGGHQFGGHQFGLSGGWTGDLPDVRDRALFPPVGSPRDGEEPPAALDLAVPEPGPTSLVDWQVPVLQQSPLQSCVSCAVASVVRHLDADGRPVADPGPSAMFLYYNTRALEGTGRCDVGTGIRSALKALRRWGVCSEERWAYARQLAERPAQEAYDHALYAGTVTYRHVYRLGQEPDGLDLTAVRRALANGLPVLFGFGVYDSFQAAGRGEPVPLPSPAERVLFGHAAVLVGYDEEGFTAVNSWGEDWGDRGRFRLPTAYLQDRRLARDLWVITSLDGAEGTTPG